MQKKPGFFYGWVIAIIAFLNLFVWSGCGFYGFSLFVPSLQAEFGWGRGPLLMCVTLFSVIGALGSPVVGRLVDKIGAKMVMVVGAIAFGLGFIVAATTNSLWQLYAGYVLIGFASAGIGSVPSAKVVSAWFKRKRGTAIGIMGAGVGAGGFVLVPIIGGFVIPHFGWRMAFVFMAVVAWIIIPAILAFIRMAPDPAKGQFVDGDASASKAAGGPPPGLTPTQAYRTAAFWLIAFTFAVLSFAMAGILMNMVPNFVDQGVNMAVAAGALGLVGLFSAIMKFVFGWLCDVIPAHVATAIGLGFQLAAIALLITIGPSSPIWMMYAFAILMGTAAGQWLPTMAVITSRSFGLANYGTIFGIITMFQMGGAAGGPPIMGAMFDATGSYKLAFIIALGLSVLSVVSVLMIRKPQAMKDLEP